MDQDSPGSLLFPTPRATQAQSRWIPSLHWKGKLKNLSIQAAVYFDRSVRRYENPPFVLSETQSEQTGGEISLGLKKWNASMVYRSTSFQQNQFTAPDETLVSWSLRRKFGFLGIEWIPQIEWTYLSPIDSRFKGEGGFFPSGRLGLKKNHLFSRNLSKSSISDHCRSVL